MGASPGWYEDPAEPGSLRWWDGSNWTGHRDPPAAPPVAPRSGIADPPWLAPPTAQRRRARGVHPAVGAAALAAGLLLTILVADPVQRGVGDFLDQRGGHLDEEAVAEGPGDGPGHHPAADGASDDEPTHHQAGDEPQGGGASQQDAATALDVAQELPAGIVASEFLALPERYTDKPWTPLHGKTPALSLSTAERWLRIRFWEEVSNHTADQVEALGFTDATAHTWAIPESATSARVTAEVVRFDGDLEMGAWRAGEAICSSLPAWRDPQTELTAFADVPALCVYQFTAADEAGSGVYPEGIGALLPHGPYLLHVQAMHSNFDTALVRAAELAAFSHERLAEVADSPGQATAIDAEPARHDDVVLHEDPSGLGGPLHTPPAEGAHGPFEGFPRTVVATAEEWASAHLGDWGGADDAAEALAELGFRYETADEWGAPSATPGVPEQVRAVRVLAFGDGDEALDARQAARYVCDLFPMHMANPHDVWFPPGDDDVPSPEALSALDELPVVCFEFEESPAGPEFQQAKVTLVHGPYVIRAWGIAPSRTEALDVLADVAADAHARVADRTLR